MSRPSFTEVWDQARAFVTAEAALLVPVALTCFAIPSLLLQVVVPEPVAPQLLPTAGPWLWWFVPVLATMVFGSMALSVMALVPAVSVAEAFRRALGRLPVALASFAMLLFAAVLWASILGQLVQAAPRGASVFLLVLLTGLLIGAVRLAFLWPAIIDGHQGPVAVIRGVLALTRNKFWRLLGVVLLATVLTVLLVLVAQLAGGSLLILLGRAAGNETLGLGLMKALTAIVAGLCRMVIVVYIALLYRAAAQE
jgi:hypothetical protein